MNDESTTSPAHTETSPWPLLVAVGLALSEVGVIIGLRPVSVAGLLLFVGTVAGILTESGYISRPALAIGAQSFVLIGIGITLIYVNRVGTTLRGQSIVIAGILGLTCALLWVGYSLLRAKATEPTTESSEATSD